MNKKYTLILILFLAAFLRFFALGSGDPLTDEVLYSFRSVGMIDFSEARDQPSVIEILDPQRPAWTKLSFHDHPPLVFSTQNFFINIFGENNFAARLPSALFGIASVFLLYLLAKNLFGEKTGLLSGLFLAVNTNHIYISRLAMQESAVIFFILLTCFFFFKSLEKSKFWLWTGLAFGLGILAKYTTFLILPVLFLYLLFFKRRAFSDKYLWWSSLLALFVFSPVLIFNLKLYQSLGHFDFQISHMLGKAPSIWSVAPGKEIGTLVDRIQSFFPNIFASYFYLFLVLVVFSLFIIAIKYKNYKKESLFFLLFSILITILVLLKIGPSRRFLTMLSPWLVIVAALGSRFLFRKKVGIIFLTIFIFLECLYVINTFLLSYSRGLKKIHYSPVSADSYRWGYNQLGKYFGEKLKDKVPALTFDLKYKFLNDLQAKALEEGKEKGYQLYPVLIIYDDNMYRVSSLWTLERLAIYHGWPVLQADKYFEFFQSNGEDYFVRSGFKDFYFVYPTDNILKVAENKQTKSGQELKDFLEDKEGVNIELIKNPKGEEAFWVYHWKN